MTKQRSVPLSTSTWRAIREWQRVARREGRGGLGPAALVAAALSGMPTELSDALDLVGITPDEVFNERFQATLNIPPELADRLSETMDNINYGGMNGRLALWQVVAAAVNQLLDAEGGFGYGVIGAEHEPRVAGGTSAR